MIYDDSLKTYDANYKDLERILKAALTQASEGKGQARHADYQAWDEQPIFWIDLYFGSFHLGQAVKKIHESQRMKPELAIQELYGAINYIAARIRSLELQKIKGEV